MSKYSYTLDLGKELNKQKDSQESSNSPKSGEELGAKEVKDQLQTRTDDEKKIQIKPLDEKSLNQNVIDGDDKSTTVSKADEEDFDEDESFFVTEPLTDSEKDVMDIISEVSREKKQEQGFLMRFFDNHQIPIFLFLVIFFALFNLTSTQRMGTLDEISDRDINAQLLSSATRKIFFDWPFLSSLEKQKKISELYGSLLKDPKLKIKKKQIAETLKNKYKDIFGQTYLYSDDSYFELLHAEKLAEGKFSGDFLANIVYYFYVFLNKFNFMYSDEISLVTTAFYTPVFFGVLMSVLVFFITKYLSRSPLASFFAAFLLIINHAFFSKTYAGNLNTAMLHLCFSVVFNLLLIYVLSAPNAVKVINVLAIVPLFILYVNIHNYMWKIWIAVTIFFMIILFVFYVFRFRQNALNPYYVFAGIFALLFAMMFVLDSTSFIFVSPQDLFTGRAVMFLGIVGASAYIVRNLKKIRPKEVFVVAWFISLLFMSYTSKSAQYLLSVPVSILGGIFLDKFYDFLKSFVRELKTGLSEATMGLSLFVLILSVILLANGNNVSAAKAFHPEPTDAHEYIASFVEEDISENSSENKKLLVMEDYNLWEYFAKIRPVKEKRPELRHVLLSNYDEAVEKISCQNCSYEMILTENSLYDLLSESGNDEYKLLLSKISECFEVEKEKINCGGKIISPADLSINDENSDLLVVVNSIAQENFKTGSESTFVVYNDVKNKYYFFVVNGEAKNSAIVRMLAGSSVPGFKLRASVSDPVRIVLYSVDAKR